MEIKTLKTFTDDMNIEYKLFINGRGMPAIRAYDLDVCEVIGITCYPSVEKASEKYDALILKVQA